MQQFQSSSPEETEQVGAYLAAKLRAGDVIAYRGPMGVGKTAFTRGLARGLGCEDAVCSPTFSLINEYAGGKYPLYHFDIYRIEGFEDLYSTGFFDYLDAEGILAIEWSEKMEESLTFPHITVTITQTGDEEREITIDGDDRF